jgi:hypothetical protein
LISFRADIFPHPSLQIAACFGIAQKSCYSVPFDVITPANKQVQREPMSGGHPAPPDRAMPRLAISIAGAISNEIHTPDCLAIQKILNTACHHHVPNFDNHHNIVSGCPLRYRRLTLPNAQNLIGRRCAVKIRQPVAYTVLGAMVMLGLVFVVGAGQNDAPIGRYQISTCLKRDWVYVYVVDTATGAVKFVDEKNENKPFEEIKSTR